MHKPLISVITIVKNGEGHIERTLMSVTAQVFDDYEYIVIDGESKDGTVNIIRKFQDKIDCFVSEADDGIADAFNKGIEMSQGLWLNFMNAGDTFVDCNTLSSCVEQLRALPSDYLLMTGYAVNKRNNFIYPIVKLRNNMHLFDKSRQAHQASFFNRTLFEKYGGFSQRFSIVMDLDFYMRVLKEEKFYFCDKQICTFDTSGVSSNYFKTAWQTIVAQFANRRYWFDVFMIPVFIIIFLVRKTLWKLNKANKLKGVL